MALPAGTVVPWYSTSWVTTRAVAWPVGSKRNDSSITLGMSERSCTTSRRWSGCSARSLASQPMSRPVVSLPAPAITAVYVSTSSRVSVRRSPCSSSNSALSRRVIRSSDGCLARQSMYSANMSPFATFSCRTCIGCAASGAQVGVGLLAHRDLVVFGDAEEHPDDAHRHHRRELGDHVEAAGADERIEDADAVLAHLVLELGHRPGREHARHEAAVHAVLRRVLEHDHAAGELDAGADDVEDVAAGVRERLPVHEAAFDIGTARQRPEVEVLVVVDRRLVAEARVGGVGVGVDADVVGVEVHRPVSCTIDIRLPPRKVRALVLTYGDARRQPGSDASCVLQLHAWPSRGDPEPQPRRSAPACSMPPSGSCSATDTPR